MYLTIAVYLICIALIIWGAKFAGFKANYHEDFLSLDKTKAVRGLAAFCVLLHHISQETTFQNQGEIQFFLDFGAHLVAIFFFCSGFGLVKAVNTKKDYLNGFLKKRVVMGILITFYVNVILYAIYHLIAGDSFPAVRWVTNFIGFTLMNEYAWFPIVLMLLYVTFYFVFKYVKNRKICFLLMFLAIILQGMCFCVGGHFAWWADKKNWWLSPMGFENAKWWMQEKTIWFFGQWWVNSSIGFFIGMIFAQYEEKLVGWFKRFYWIKLVVVAILAYVFQNLSLYTQAHIGYYTEWSGNGPGIVDKIITYAAQLPQMTFWVVFVFIITMKISIGNPVLKFFGKYSLDTYMMNLIAIISFRFLIYKGDIPVHKAGDYNLAIYAVCVIAATVILGLIEYYIVDFIKKKISKLA